ncbi:MAG: GntR family transcriptional regulator [Gammaproteobacteria bacterium]
MTQGSTAQENDPVTDLISRLQLNEHSSEPYYLQLKRQLNAMIEGGDLKSGVNLPSERTLAEAMQISRTTVKRCYDELRSNRLLSTHGRGGTVVQAPPRVNPTMGRLKGFTEEMREQGKVSSTRVLQCDVVAERTIACMFERPSVSPFLRLVRVRMADGVPMTREVAWYDLTAAAALEDWDTGGSVYAFLQDKCGILLVRADQTIEAVMSSPEESDVFGFASPSPCLLLKRHTYSSADQLIEYVEGTFRGDAYVYKVNLGT